MTRRVLAAPDKFRESATAHEVAGSIARGADLAGWSCHELPLADGGEGTLDALGRPNRTSPVTGPLGSPVDADWRLDGELAVIEMARASGLALAGGADRNAPLTASTRGTGELIAAALDAGATRVIVGVGGSATTDGGLGAVEALDWLPFNSRGATVEVACDVQTLFVDAASVFGPQKGASAADVVELTERLRRRSTATGGSSAPMSRPCREAARRAASPVDWRHSVPPSRAGSSSSRTRWAWIRRSTSRTSW